MVALFLFSFLASAAMTIVLIRWAREHSKQYPQAMPQRFHVGDVPRLGGIAILFGGFVAASMGVLGPSLGFNPNISLGWPFLLGSMVFLLPSVIAGAFEDLTQRVTVGFRLLLTSISALIACAAMGLAVVRLGISDLDSVWSSWSWAGGLLAFIAISGLPHSFNLIDGYNGLAGAVALLVALSLAHVCLQVGDRQLAGLLICLSGATCGFLLLNYPRGLIFAGDSGAYLWGASLAAISIALVQRHPQVSPWFPLLLLIYPVVETLFSVYRRLARGAKPSVADALHFHQLVYRRIVRQVFHDDEARRMLMRNNRTSPYLWSLTLFSVLPAVLFWDSTIVLMAFTWLFIVCYVAAYLMMVRFKVPGWLRR